MERELAAQVKNRWCFFFVCLPFKSLNALFLAQRAAKSAKQQPQQAPVAANVDDIVAAEPVLDDDDEDNKNDNNDKNNKNNNNNNNSNNSNNNNNNNNSNSHRRSNVNQVKLDDSFPTPPQGL